jgi:hypothetical protein
MSSIAVPLVGPDIPNQDNAQRFGGRLSSVGEIVNSYNNIAASGRRVLALVNYPTAIDDLDDPANTEDVKRHVTYDDVYSTN